VIDKIIRKYLIYLWSFISLYIPWEYWTFILENSNPIIYNLWIHTELINSVLCFVRYFPSRKTFCAQYLSENKRTYLTRFQVAPSSQQRHRSQNFRCHDAVSKFHSFTNANRQTQEIWEIFMYIWGIGVGFGWRRHSDACATVFVGCLLPEKKRLLMLGACPVACPIERFVKRASRAARRKGTCR